MGNNTITSLDTNQITAIATACLVIVGFAQVILSLALIHFNRRLSISTTKYTEQVERQTKLMDRSIYLADKEKKLHEYEDKRESLIRRRDNLIKELDNLIGPLYSILDSKEYFDLDALVKDRYSYIQPPQASRDYIFNRKAYDVLNFWEKIQQNI